MRVQSGQKEHIEVDRDFAAELFAGLALEAAVAVMRVYATESHVRHKADHSPVCDADEQAEAIILEGLAEHLPFVPVLAEEAASRGEMPTCGRTFILVDPVDGTREFIGRNGEFTINIALVVDGTPCAGVVYAPALGHLWMAAGTACHFEIAPGVPLPPRAQRRTIRARPTPAEGLTALASRSHGDMETEAFLARLPVAARRPAGSSLKFCLIAAGEADVYPRFGPTMEWDTAAGDAVLRAAGGIVVDAAGQPLRYGKAQSRFRNGAFVAWGDPDAAVQAVIGGTRS